MKLAILFGESGSGKDYIFKKLVEKYPNLFNPIVRMTTRPKRKGEVNKKTYTFVSEEVMAQELLDNNILAVEIFNGWYYGLPANSFDENKINLCILAPQSIEILEQDKPNDLQLYKFYIQADDKVRLERSLKREKNPDCVEVCRRFLADKTDFSNLDFSYTIIKNMSKTPPLKEIIDLLF